jgi:excisionase family DNA binding protein
MKLLTETQVAELYGIRKPCLRRWRHEKRGLPFVRVGRLIRYRPQDLEAFESANLRLPKHFKVEDRSNSD